MTEAKAFQRDIARGIQKMDKEISELDDSIHGRFFAHLNSRLISADLCRSKRNLE